MESNITGGKYEEWRGRESKRDMGRIRKREREREARREGGRVKSMMCRLKENLWARQIRGRK